MAFLDAARKMAEQAQVRLDLVQRQFAADSGEGSPQPPAETPGVPPTEPPASAPPPEPADPSPEPTPSGPPRPHGDPLTD